jgi:gliding-associated putative ABC transporter substrate-binding component GldG
VQLNSLQTEENIEKFNRKNIPVAVLLEGTFSSLFANRVSQAQLNTLKNNDQQFLRASNTAGKIIVVSDADIVLNQVSETIGPLPMGVNKYTKIQYANKDFFLNAVEYLANKNNILDARAKDYTLRLLDVKKVTDQRLLWQLVNIVLPVLLVIIGGGIFQWWRKKKYTRV